MGTVTPHVKRIFMTFVARGIGPAAPARLGIRACRAYSPSQMRTSFIKMHGLGNDFVIFDARTTKLELTPSSVMRLADRRHGIGCDQLIILRPSARADVFMQIMNPDGSEAQACGNATRCVAHLLGGNASIETLGGLLTAGNSTDGISIAMGMPSFAWQDVPLAYAMDTLCMPVAWDGLANPVGVSMGNPHAVFFVPSVAAVPLETLGLDIEHDPLFPERVNVNIATVDAADQITLRVWERGAGLTLACGSGACATFAAARKRGLVGPSATVSLPGGDLLIAESETGALIMTGPVATSFTGEVEL